MFKISKRVFSLGIATTIAALLASTGYSSAGTIAYDVPVNTAGTQEFSGSLGMDFDVISTINVTHLGVFDDGSDGINRTVGVSIYNRDTMTTLFAPLAFTGSADALIGGSRFRSISPLTLMAGFKGTIVAFNYGMGERNGNTGTGSVAGTTNDGGGLISFVGMSRFSGGGWPNTIDAGPANRYHAGTFMFEAARVPEPGTLALFGLGLAGLGFARRRKVAA